MSAILLSRGAILSTNHKGVIVAFDCRWSEPSRAGVVRGMGSTSTDRGVSGTDATVVGTISSKVPRQIQTLSEDEYARGSSFSDANGYRRRMLVEKRIETPSSWRLFVGKA